MARFDFGGTLADFVVTSRRLGGLDVLGLASATLTFWSAQTGGTRYTDLVLNGSAVSSVPVGTDGQVPTFQGPDAVTAMWADGGSGRVRIVAQGIPGPAGPGATSADIAGYVTSLGPTQTALDARYTKKADGDVFNVKAYGAKGDGSTDDTTAIQNAANDACAAKGKLVFPASSGAYMVNPAVTNASGTSVSLINLTGPCSVVIERGATVKVISSTTPFVCVFGGQTTTIDMSGMAFTGGGTIDCNSAARIAAHVVPSDTTPCTGIRRINKGNGITVRDLRFTNFNSIWCISLSSSGPGNMTNVEVAHCQFDNLGTPTAADRHDFSAMYIDAIGMNVHDNHFWQGAPGATTYSTNYGVRTAIELHGSGQHCYDNDTHGLQWGGNLWVSYNCWTETDATGSRNSVGSNWHDNTFEHCAVGVNIGGANNLGFNYGHSGVKVHHNNITVDPTLWNTDTGGGTYASGILVATSQQTGSWTGITLADNDIRITPNNTAMNTFTWTTSPSATPATICFILLGTNTVTVRELVISGNTLHGSGQDGVRVSAYSFENVDIVNNKVSDCHLITGGTGYGVYLATNGSVAGTNNMNSCRIAGNSAHDDQHSTNSPYGYVGQTLSGVVFCAAGSASNATIFDNTYWCRSSSTVPVVQGFASSPSPLVRATDHAPTFSAPSGLWAAGSTITTTTQRNAVAPTPAVWVQTAANSGGSGSVWQRRPTFSGVVAKTAAYTALTGDIVLADPTTAAFTVTLPAVQAGAEVTVKNTGTANSVTVATTAAKLIDGVSTATLTSGQKSKFASDGTNWFSV